MAIVVRRLKSSCFKINGLDFDKVKTMYCPTTKPQREISEALIVLPPVDHTKVSDTRWFSKFRHASVSPKSLLLTFSGSAANLPI